MKRIVIAAVGLTFGCVSTPQPSHAPPVCGDGVAVLRFNPNGRQLEQSTLGSLDWVANIVSHCEVSDIFVRGLPEPSSSTAAGRQAQLVLSATRARRIPAPIFDFSDAEDRLNPVLAFKARAKSQ